MLIFVLISSASVWVRGQTFNTISEKIARDLRYDLFYFLINKDVSFFDEMKTGDILSRMTSDTQVV
jgi:ABC-type multidrug transport system fused ATPase/permease subunit